MADVTIFHNPKCSTSSHAMQVIQELGVDADVVLYLKQHPDREQLQWLVDHLEDPVADLVRKDAHFGQLGLDESDYVEPQRVIELLLEHPELLQRPIIVKGDKAIIGRPKDRVRELLEA
jgi:arsenate reductase (glutaredoxin)